MHQSSYSIRKDFEEWSIRSSDSKNLLNQIQLNETLNLTKIIKILNSVSNDNLETLVATFAIDVTLIE